jgi:transposase
MSQTSCDFPKLEAVTVSDDGRRRYYDRRAKQALVEACLQPGASLAGLALKAGVNANLLRRWVRKHVSVHEAAAATVVSEPAVSAFVFVTRLNEPDATSALCPPPSSQGKPVHAVHPTVPARLVAQLPNGVSLELDIGQDAMLLKAAIDALRGH